MNGAFWRCSPARLTLWGEAAGNMPEMDARTARELADWLGETEVVLRRMTVKELCDVTIRRIELRQRARRALPLPTAGDRRLPPGDR